MQQRDTCECLAGSARWRRQRELFGIVGRVQLGEPTGEAAGYQARVFNSGQLKHSGEAHMHEQHHTAFRRPSHPSRPSASRPVAPGHALSLAQPGAPPAESLHTADPVIGSRPECVEHVRQHTLTQARRRAEAAAIHRQHFKRISTFANAKAQHIHEDCGA